MRKSFHATKSQTPNTSFNNYNKNSKAVQKRTPNTRPQAVTLPKEKEEKERLTDSVIEEKIQKVIRIMTMGKIE